MGGLRVVGVLCVGIMVAIVGGLRAEEPTIPLYLYNGNVGVGTEMPAAMLDVSGNLKVRGPAAFRGFLDVGYDTDGLGKLSFHHSHTTPGNRYYTGWVYRNSQGSLALESSDSNNLNIQFGGSVNYGTLSFQSVSWNAETSQKTATTRMVIKGDSGNVGIGTTNPGSLLTIGTKAAFVWSPSLEVRDTMRLYDASSSSHGLRMGFVTNQPYLQGYRETVGAVNLLINPNGGNVGVGTSSPLANLHVSGSGFAQPISAMRGVLGISTGGSNDTNYGIVIGEDINALSSSSAGTLSLFFNRGAGTASGTKTAGMQLVHRSNNDASAIAGGKILIQKDSGGNGSSVQIYSNDSTERLRITSAGNVGIGISSPLAPLVVVGPYQSASYKNTIGTFESANYGINQGGGVGIGGRIRSTTTEIGHFALIGGRKENATEGDVAGSFVVETRVSGGGLTEKLRVTSTGDVGIGTTSPEASLHIAKSVDGDFTALKLMNLQGSGSIRTGVGIDFHQFNSSEPVARILAQQDGTSGYQGNLQFYTRGVASNTAPVERLRITSAGNVGIGTATPTTKLQVIGTVNATAFVGDGSGLTNISGGWSSGVGVFYTDRKVGVGTSVPNAALDVATGSIVLNSNTGTSTAVPVLSTSRVSGEISAYGSNGFGSDAGFLRLSAGGGTTIIEKSYIDLTGYNTISNDRNTIRLGTAGVERVRITSAGNVGIGTTTPTEKLDVNGYIRTSSGPSAHYGWGSVAAIEMPAGDLDLERPNLTVGKRVYRFNQHTGMSFSAHSYYGGIRFYNQGSDSLAGYKASGGASLVMALTNGSVGIGIATPNAKLHVNGDVYSKSFSTPYSFEWTARSATFPNGSQNQKLYIDLGPIRYWGSLEVTIYDGWSHLRTTGKMTKLYDIGVNIGSPYPSQSRLTESFGHVATQWKLGEVEVGADNRIRIPIYHLASQQNAITVHIKGYTTLITRGAEYDFVLTTPEPSTHTLDVEHVSMALGADQKIGVGTTVPTIAKMDISIEGVGKYPLYIENKSTSGTTLSTQLRLGSYDGTSVSVAALFGALASTWTHSAGGGIANSAILNGVKSGGLSLAASHASGAVRFYSGGETSAQERLRITNVGNVGIGTPSPTQPLHVSGNALISSRMAINAAIDNAYALNVGGAIRATEMVVNVNGWADYVFDPEYVLRPLSEVERFVKEKRHLPGVPSEAELAAAGLNMAKMQTLQMQKIEELTLYVIALEKQNKALEARLEALEKGLAR